MYVLFPKEDGLRAVSPPSLSSCQTSKLVLVNKEEGKKRPQIFSIMFDMVSGSANQWNNNRMERNDAPSCFRCLRRISRPN